MTTTINASTAGAGGLITAADNSGTLALQTAGTTAVTIDSSQKMGIGTSSPSGKLSVISSSVPCIHANTSDVSDVIYVAANTGGSSSSSLYVMPIRVGSTSTFTGGIYYNGSSLAYNTTSDYRLKENIQPMQNALATVAQLNPVTYNWKSDGRDGQGFIAHELQSVVPDCVTGEKDAIDADGNPVYQGIDTSFLVATLTKAIQEQQAIITDLKARIETLEAA